MMTGTRVEVAIDLQELLFMDPNLAEKLLSKAENLLKTWQGSYLKVHLPPTPHPPFPTTKTRNLVLIGIF